MILKWLLFVLLPVAWAEHGWLKTRREPPCALYLSMRWDCYWSRHYVPDRHVRRSHQEHLWRQRRGGCSLVEYDHHCNTRSVRLNSDFYRQFEGAMTNEMTLVLLKKLRSRCFFLYFWRQKWRDVKPRTPGTDWRLRRAWLSQHSVLLVFMQLDYWIRLLLAF